MFVAQRLSLSWVLGAAFALSAALGFSACNRNKYTIEIDHRFSYNLAKVPPWFPGKMEDVTPGQQEALRRFGPPDFIRFWWMPDGSPISSADLSGIGAKLPTVMGETKRTWIYLGPDKELEFLPNGGYLEHKVPEKIRLIAQYGDPNRRDAPRVDAQGRKRESWFWYEYGLKLELLDGQEVARSYFSPTGRGTWGGK